MPWPDRRNGKRDEGLEARERFQSCDQVHFLEALLEFGPGHFQVVVREGLMDRDARGFQLRQLSDLGEGLVVSTCTR